MTCASKSVGSIVSQTVEIVTKGFWRNQDGKIRYPCLLSSPNYSTGFYRYSEDQCKRTSLESLYRDESTLSLYTLYHVDLLSITKKTLLLSTINFSPVTLSNKGPYVFGPSISLSQVEKVVRTPITLNSLPSPLPKTFFLIFWSRFVPGILLPFVGRSKSIIFWVPLRDNNIGLQDSFKVGLRRGSVSEVFLSRTNVVVRRLSFLNSLLF